MLTSTRVISIGPSLNDKAIRLGPGRRTIDAETGLRLDRDRTYADYYYARGLSYQSKGELDLALADFSQAIWLDFEHPRAYVARASTFKAKGDLSSALADYNKPYHFRSEEN